MKIVALALAIGMAALGAATPLNAAPVYGTREEMLARAFPPPATIERKTFFLTAGQRDRASRLAAAKVESSLVVGYVGRWGMAILGTAYFDTHMVRTQTETLCITVLPDGSAGAVEVVAFHEPEDYLPTPRWMEQFPGRSLDDELSLSRGIRSLSGATLSARAITGAARRVLALHRLFVDPKAGPEAVPRGTPGEGR